MKDKKTILLLLVGILLGVTIMGGVVCFAVSKVKLVDKTYAAKVNNSNEGATKSTKEVPVYEYYESKVEESKKENQTPIQILVQNQIQQKHKQIKLLNLQKQKQLKIQ